MTAQDLLPKDAFDSIDFLADIFKSVGPDIVKNAGNVKHTDKADGSPVTDIDVETENKIRSKFSIKYPNIAIFGEESGYPNNLPELVWLIDPIDGTESFINNIPAYTCMGVLIYRDQAVGSVIYNPSSDDMFVAKLGMGTTKNSIPLNLVDLPLKNIILCKKSILPQVEEIFKEGNINCQYTPNGGGYGFTMILDNLADARLQVRGGGYLHDYAPGALLVSEAGGDLLPVLENSYSYRTRSFIACHPKLTELMKNRLRLIRSLEDPKNTSF